MGLLCPGSRDFVPHLVCLAMTAAKGETVHYCCSGDLSKPGPAESGREWGEIMMGGVGEGGMKIPRGRLFLGQICKKDPEIFKGTTALICRVS